MNTINKLIAISATLFAMTLPSNAQSTKGSQDFALFNAVEISNYFDATLVQGTHIPQNGQWMRLSVITLKYMSKERCSM